MVARLLCRLDEKGREIALLHHVEGWTQEEVAERTGISRKTVGKKLAQFAELLRQEWVAAQPWRTGEAT